MEERRRYIAAMQLAGRYSYAGREWVIERVRRIIGGEVTGGVLGIVALYVAVLDLPAWANAAMVLAFAALVFVRIGYVYPTRTPTLRSLTLALMAAWGVMLLLIIWWMPVPPRALVLASLVFPIYYMGLSLILHARR